MRSYDHNHRQRLADMKKLTARNDEESRSQNKRPGDMKSIPIDAAANKKPGAGPRFTKIGGGGGGGFTKVGVAVGKTVGEKKSGEEAAEEDRMGKLMREQAEIQKKIEALKAEKEKKGTESPKPASTYLEKENEESIEQDKDEDVVMGEADDLGKDVKWEEYDFTKPTECDHTNCPGCKTDGIWDDPFEREFELITT